MRAEDTKDFSLFLTSFYLKLTGIWSATNPAEERKRKRSFALAMALMFVGLVVEVRDLYHTYSVSFADTIYIMCNLVTVSLVLCKMCLLYIQRKRFRELIAYEEANFWHTDYDPNEKILMDRCKSTCLLFLCIFNCFAQSTTLSYVIEPTVEYFTFNITSRRLPFNLYWDYPLRPYVYEVTFVFQVSCLFAYGIGYLCVDNFMCVTNLHTATQFRILQYRFANILRDNDMEKHSGISKELSLYHIENCYAVFKKCIQQHQSLIEFCKNVTEVFTFVVLGQVLLFSIMICLDGYLMLLEGTSPYRRAIFTIHLVGCFFQLLMFTYCCDCVMQESTEVAESVYAAKWPLLPMNNSAKMLRSDMLLVIMRSREPCCMSAGGFFMVSLQTYTKVISTAASYFTLLREY